MEQNNTAEQQDILSFDELRNQILEDFKLACISRETSLLGRKEVLTGKAKFGIFGDGKELAQIAMAKQFKNGDFRSGYYRDQTFMMAIGQLSVREFFASLYATPDSTLEPSSGGRQMNGHFATHSLDEKGHWKKLTSQKNSSADISPTAGQMPRLLGLAQASKVYRNNPLLKDFTQFSIGGNEVAFGTIGDASTSEGHFWETINAACVLQVPMAMSVWDDGYGISVPKKFQTAKASISQALSGLDINEDSAEDETGIRIFKTKGWDYVSLVDTYAEAIAWCRENHKPVLIHVEEVTQPQGHSTSGSHERYKSKETLQWTQDFDCINQFKIWILNTRFDGKTLASANELESIQTEAKSFVRAEQKAAWSDFLTNIKQDKIDALTHIRALAASSEQKPFIEQVANQLEKALDPIRKDILASARKAIRLARKEQSPAKQALTAWVKQKLTENEERYSSNLFNEGEGSALKVKEVKPTYSETSEQVDGRIILRDTFDTLLSRHPEMLAFGEDVGKIGGVNQTWEGLQEKYGDLRVSDTGIREATILGQGIGMAMRGLRPIAEIQYLDYLLYAIQTMSDDLATVRWRTKGRQKAPVIVSTRGHRLEGIWHSGSPMGMIINSIRGVHVCVPRNMVTAAGFYNTLMQSDEPALVIEPLNGYRTKEKRPDNLGEYTTPLGVPEVVKEGKDITVVSYGSTCNLVLEAVKELNALDIDAEIIDVRTLLPFDIHHSIAKSLQKTNRLLIVDEDVSSGATAFILDKIINEQNGYHYLDSKPETLSAKDHRPAYSTDGDYFSKPNIEDIVEKIYGILHESNPKKYPNLF
ncbi:MAG: alpha-ketoacid dehydrogenase subunit alpha/beta [Luteibaculaceae bacterium]